MIVDLHYFKPSGKWYAHGEHHTDKKWLFEIVEEVAALKNEGHLPGLMEGHSNFSVLVSVFDQGKHMLWGDVEP